MAEDTAAGLPLMAIDTLLENAIDDTSSDYNDGDHPGYYRHTWDAETNSLRLFYEPDADPDIGEEHKPAHGATVATFRLVDLSTGRLAETATEADIRSRYADELNDGEDHAEAIVQVLRDRAATDPTDRDLGVAVRVLLAIADET